MNIDAHQHFWQYHPAHQVWMTDQMRVLRRDYLPGELKPLTEAIGFAGTIAVQARQMVEETEWLLKLADEHDFIQGVVGWVDLRSPNLREQLEQYARHPKSLFENSCRGRARLLPSRDGGNHTLVPKGSAGASLYRGATSQTRSKLVGVRHVVHDEPDDHFLLRPEFRRGLAQLREFDLTYDLLLFPKHLTVAAQLVAEFPDQPFVLDHLAKPAIRDGQVSPWQDDLRRLAECPKVFCKLSGMVTEARWQQWRPDDFHRYLDIVIAAFGTDRVMIGSDWPVCTLSGEYAQTMNIVIDYVQQFPSAVRAAILGGTCARFYGLKPSATER